jgi:hypothetical protein
MMLNTKKGDVKMKENKKDCFAMGHSYRKRLTKKELIDQLEAFDVTHDHVKTELEDSNEELKALQELKGKVTDHIDVLINAVDMYNQLIMKRNTDQELFLMMGTLQAFKKEIFWLSKIAGDETNFKLTPDPK